MNTRLLSLVAASLFVPGCFSPEVDPEAQDSDASEGSSSETDTDSPSTTAGTTDDPPTNPSTTDDPTTSPSTTDEPTTTTNPSTTDDDSGSDSGGPDPFCGDGNLDPGEDCDDGDGNGLDQACLPDCNLNVCGDGNLGPDEVCDDGEGNNVLEVGACAPDCSTVIEEKVITVGETVLDGDLGNNPVATADGTCPVGYSALFAYPGVRQATTSANSVVNPIDWVLSPWTFYVRPSGELVWATDATALLGVRDGVPMMLETAIYTSFIIGAHRVITGLEGDWTTSVSSTCDGWTSSTASVRPGIPDSTSSPSFLRGNQTVSCENLTNCPGAPLACTSFAYFYCVEQ